MEATDAAYVAGIIDGEGTITMARTSVLSENCFNVQFVVANTSLRMLEHVLRVTGSGSIVGRRPREGSKTGYRWLCATADVGRVLAAIRPYLVVKREQADLVLEYVGLRDLAKQAHKKGVLPEDRERRLEIFNRVRELNRRGIDLPLEPGQRERISSQPYRGRRKTNEEMEAKIVSLLMKGTMPALQIAEELGISRTVVRRLARENGVETPYGRRRQPEAGVER